MNRLYAHTTNRSTITSCNVCCSLDQEVEELRHELRTILTTISLKEYELNNELHVLFCLALHI